MKYIFFLCLGLILILSCKKKDDEKMMISGQVQDPNQNIIVAGVTVDLYVKKIESGLYSAGYSLIQSQNTDNSGNFSFSFDAVMASEYKVCFRKTGYFNFEQVINSDKVTKGNDYNQIYAVHSEAYLKLHIVNNLPNSNLDQITYRVKQGYLNALGCCWDSFYTYVGKNVNIYQKCKVYGYQKLIFEWNVQTTTSVLFYKDSVFCNGFDTTFFEIPY